jgi:hypothetical protein
MAHFEASDPLGLNLGGTTTVLDLEEALETLGVAIARPENAPD